MPTSHGPQVLLITLDHAMHTPSRGGTPVCPTDASVPAPLSRLRASSRASQIELQVFLARCSAPRAVSATEWVNIPQNELAQLLGKEQGDIAVGIMMGPFLEAEEMIVKIEPHKFTDLAGFLYQ